MDQTDFTKVTYKAGLGSVFKLNQFKEHIC